MHIVYILILVGLVACVLYYICFVYNKSMYDHMKETSILQTIRKEIEVFEQKNETNLQPKELFKLGELYQYGKFGKQKDLKTALFYFKACINASIHDKYTKGLCYLAIATVYEELNSTNIYAVIENYLHAIEHGFEEGILMIGKIYMNGLHPYYLPEKFVAGKIFSKYLHFSSTLTPWCKLYLQQIYELDYVDLDSIQQPGVLYKQLPLDILDRLNNSVSKARTYFPYKVVFNEDWLKKNYDEKILLKLPKQIVKNDTQNVHDHTLQNIGKKIIQQLDINKGDAVNNTFNVNVTDLLKHVDESKYTNIKRVCNSLSTSIHSKYEKSEQDVFNLVWSKIKHDKNLIIMFIENLESSIEHDIIVCSTGKIMRMLSTLDILDSDTPTLKPEWVIREEISRIISNIIEKLNAKEKKEYESEENNKIVEIIRNRVIDKCKKDYGEVLDENIMNFYLEYI